MKATGMIRRVDEIGRVSIPKHLRDKLRINVGDPVEIYVDRGMGAICIKKYKGDHIDEFEDLIEDLRTEGGQDMLVATLESLLAVYQKSLEKGKESNDEDVSCES